MSHNLTIQYSTQPNLIQAFCDIFTSIIRHIYVEQTIEFGRVNKKSPRFGITLSFWVLLDTWATQSYRISPLQLLIYNSSLISFLISISQTNSVTYAWNREREIINITDKFCKKCIRMLTNSRWWICNYIDEVEIHMLRVKVTGQAQQIGRMLININTMKKDN